MRARFVAAAIGVALATGCGLVLGLEDHDYVEAADAGPSPADDGGTGDGCAAPSCEGRCQNILAACGLGAACGACGEGQTCNGTTQVCECPSTCGENKCGQIPNNCDGSSNCGTCQEGSSCRTGDAGHFECLEGGCVEPPVETTCAGKCRQVTSMCATTVTCPECTDKVCTPTHDCDCPVRRRGVYRKYDDNVIKKRHCVDVDYSDHPCPANFDKQIQFIGFIYDVDQAEKNIYRCSTAQGSYFLTPDPGCEKVASDGQLPVRVGSAVSRGGACGSVQIRRFTNGQDYVMGLEGTWPDTSYHEIPGASFFMWTKKQ